VGKGCGRRRREGGEVAARPLRIAEVVQLDMQLENGKVLAYRAKLKLSFKYETGE
jgi:flavin-binding protein dodecin